MAFTSAADLAAGFLAESGLPSANDEFPGGATDAAIFRYLSLAQESVFRMLATLAPQSQTAAPEKLTTADGGYTYTLARYPFGQVELRESRTGRRLEPGAEFSTSADFVQEGQTIRWCNGVQRTFTDGPYARYAPSPTDIAASAAEPTLLPAQARVLIVYRALDLWCAKGGYRDPSPFRNLFKLLAFGDPDTPGDPGIVGALRRQYYAQGGSPGRGVTSSMGQWASESYPTF